MKVVGYMRVSSEGQVDGDGFPRQTEAIERFCRAHNLTLSGFVRDEGVSGTLENRPALTQLLLDRPEVIVIERLDRLARDLLIQEVLIRKMVERGIILYSTDQGALINLVDTTADPNRKMVRQMLGAVAEAEKSNLVIKLGIGRAHKKALTGKCEGRKAFGDSPKRPYEKRIAQTVLATRALGGSFRMIQLAVKANHGTGICLSSISSVLKRAKKEAP